MFVLDDLNTSYKEIYQPKLTDAVPLAGSNALKVVESTTDDADLANLEARFAIQFAPSAVTGFRWEAEDFPEGEPPIRAQAIYRLSKHTYKIDLTREVLKRSASKEAAFASVLEEKVGPNGDVTKQLAADRSWALWNRHGEGAIVQCDTTSNSTTLVLKDPTRSELKVLRRNMPISIGTKANPGAVTVRRVIVGIDRDNGTLELDDAVTTTDAHFVFQAGSGGSTAWGSRAPISIPQIVNGSGELFGIDPSDHPEHAALEFDSPDVPQVLDEELVARVIDEVEDISGEMPDTIFARPEVVRRAEREYESRVRYAMEDQRLIKAGIQALEIHGLPVVKDSYVPDNTAYFLNLKSPNGIRWITDGQGYEDLDDGSGQAGFRHLEGPDVFRARGVGYYNVGCRQRNLHAVAHNVAA